MIEHPMGLMSSKCNFHFWEKQKNNDLLLKARALKFSVLANYKKKWIIKDESRNLTLQLQQPENDCIKNHYSPR